MKKGYMKSIDLKVPKYEEECTFVDEIRMKKKLQDRKEGKWIPNTFEWSRPQPSVQDHKINKLAESRSLLEGIR